MKAKPKCQASLGSMSVTELKSRVSWHSQGLNCQMLLLDIRRIWLRIYCRMSLGQGYLPTRFILHNAMCYKLFGFLCMPNVGHHFLFWLGCGIEISQQSKPSFWCWLLMSGEFPCYKLCWRILQKVLWYWILNWSSRLRINDRRMLRVQ